MSIITILFLIGKKTLKQLGTAKIFTTLDLKSGYSQVPLAEESKHATVFITPEGAAYKFNVMPFIRR